MNILTQTRHVAPLGVPKTNCSQCTVYSVKLPVKAANELSAHHNSVQSNSCEIAPPE